MYAAILKIISTKQLKNFTIFVATDEEPFLQFMKTKFRRRLVYYKDAYRSDDGQPLHFNQALSAYKKGEDALLDCLLLSKCNYF